MKYKVILYRDVPESQESYDAMTSLSFYTRAQAYACAQMWSGISAHNKSWVWDGITWTLF
jgi:hypothetical protein